MTKYEFVRKIAKKEGLTIKNVEHMFDTIVEELATTFEEGEDFTIIGFGKFAVTRKEESECRNPLTGEKVLVPAHNVLRFKASDTLKNRIK